MTELPTIKEWTKEEAIKLFESGWWKEKTYREIALVQMFTKRLICPFEVFHEAVEKDLGRPVWSHEFGLNVEGLKKELLGEGKAPTFEEILEMIPADKRIIVGAI